MENRHLWRRIWRKVLVFRAKDGHNAEKVHKSYALLRRQAHSSFERDFAARNKIQGGGGFKVPLARRDA